MGTHVAKLGRSLDTEGRTAYVTTLRAREQDIRRERAADARQVAGRAQVRPQRKVLVDQRIEDAVVPVLAAQPRRNLAQFRNHVVAADVVAGVAVAAPAAGFASSSEMMRLIDARISSIEGSCVLAGCVISDST